MKNVRQPQISLNAPMPSVDKCQRCGGFLVTEFLMDLSQAGGVDTPAFRCVQCGDLIDSVVLQNRFRRVEASNPRLPRQSHAATTQRGVQQIKL